MAAVLNQEEAILRILEQLEMTVPYDNAEVQLYREGAVVMAIASQVAITIKNTHLYKEAHQRAEELRHLYQAAQDMAFSLEPAVVLEQLARHITQAVNATSGLIVEIETDKDQVTIVGECYSVMAAQAEQAPMFGSTFSLSEYHQALQLYLGGEKISFFTDYPDLPDSIRVYLDKYSILSTLIVPIEGRGRLLGAAVLSDSCCQREFSPREVHLAQALALYAARQVGRNRIISYQQAHLKVASD
jgi:GAF domain-containing protein